jgi:inorganic pyrophosphatase
MATESRLSAHQAAPEQDQPRQAPAAGLLVEVVVERPGATCNLYEVDRARGGLRLERVLSGEAPQAADLARAPLEAPQSALDRLSEQIQGMYTDAGEQGASVPVLLLTRAAVAPGVWVAARLIGALRRADLRPSKGDQVAQGWTLLAVPQADPQQEVLQGVSQLSPTQRDGLAAQVLRLNQADSDALKRPEEDTGVEWMEAQEAALLVRQARATWRQAQRQRSAQARAGHGPREHLRLGKRSAEEAQPQGAWRALKGVSLQQLREHGLGADAEAEHLLRLVPQRFQQYLGELLLDDERVLCFIERPRLRRRRGLLGLGTRYLNEGVLLCTDRQVLWLRDAAAPDATLVPWGYVARSCPVERLASVQVLPAGQANQTLQLEPAPWARLVVQNAAAQGNIVFAIEFPESTLPALQQAKEILERFLPFAPGSLQAVADRRVRRLPSVSAWEPRAEERDILLRLGGLTPPAQRECLQTALAEALHPGEQVLAQAIAPALAEYAGGPRLLALTPERLLFGQARDARRGAALPQVVMTAVALEQIAAVQMRHSLLGCVFEAVVPAAGEQVIRHVVPFNSPAIVPFRAIFTRTRLLIAGSYEGQGRSGKRVQLPGGEC